jgi:hypothetical protein
LLDLVVSNPTDSAICPMPAPSRNGAPATFFPLSVSALTHPHGFKLDFIIGLAPQRSGHLTCIGARNMRECAWLHESSGHFA